MFVVTGGGSGIGRALALSLASRGKSVLIVGRRELPLVETAKLANHISYLCADVATDAGRRAVLQHLPTDEVLEGLVHNAAIIDPIAPIKQIDQQSWHQLLAVNLDAPLFLTQLLYDKLIHGRVLHIGSGAAYMAIEGWTGYCVSKASLAMLTQCWQLECEEIAFASVMPGIVDTPMQGTIRQATTMNQQKHDFFMKLYNQHQLITSETVALFLTWLLLDIDPTQFSAQEWDIYDKSHHAAWLVAPHQVPELE